MTNKETIDRWAELHGEPAEKPAGDAAGTGAEMRREQERRGKPQKRK